MEVYLTSKSSKHIKGIVELSGDGSGWVLTPYLPKSMCDNSGFIDYSKLGENQAVFKIHGGSKSITLMRFARAKDETPFVWAKATSIFSEPKFTSNVNVEFTYSFNAFEWFGYFIVQAFRKLVR